MKRETGLNLTCKIIHWNSVSFGSLCRASSSHATVSLGKIMKPDESTGVCVCVCVCKLQRAWVNEACSWKCLSAQLRAVKHYTTAEHVLLFSSFFFFTWFLQGEWRVAQWLSTLFFPAVYDHPCFFPQYTSSSILLCTCSMQGCVHFHPFSRLRSESIVFMLLHNSSQLAPETYSLVRWECNVYKYILYSAFLLYLSSQVEI